MATYTANFNPHWPDGFCDVLLGVFSDGDEAHRIVVEQLNNRYPGKWEKVNDSQYAEPYSTVGSTVMAVVNVEYTPVEFKQLQIDACKRRIADLEHELEEARQNLDGWEHMDTTERHRARETER